MRFKKGLKCEKDSNTDKKKLITCSSVETYPKRINKVSDFKTTSFQNGTRMFFVEIYCRAIVFLKNMSTQ